MWSLLCAFRGVLCCVSNERKRCSPASLFSFFPLVLRSFSRFSFLSLRLVVEKGTDLAVLTGWGLGWLGFGGSLSLLSLSVSSLSL